MSQLAFETAALLKLKYKTGALFVGVQTLGMLPE
jgi:hypothetical protein